MLTRATSLTLRRLGFALGGEVARWYGGRRYSLSLLLLLQALRQGCFDAVIARITSVELLLEVIRYEVLADLGAWLIAVSLKVAEVLAPGAAAAAATACLDAFDDAVTFLVNGGWMRGLLFAIKRVLA